jgi:phosphotransferase system HPr (HPr) family protein
MQIQRTAGAFTGKITIEGVEAGRSPVDARSLISLVSAGIRAGERIRIAADGDDAAEAVEAIRALVEKGVCHP